MKILELRDITKTYHLDKLDVPVLHGISLDIEEGEFIAIMGASGSGKSTLLHIVGLLDKPSGGSYRVAGQEVSTLDDGQVATLRNRLIGYIFQSFNLLPRMSALENVLMPLVYSDDRKGGEQEAKKHRERGIELLNRVGLGDRIGHNPNELSGGQQQRVAIARSLINNPAIIFADEPTGNLDSKSSIEIVQILRELNAQGITIVMVTHEQDIAQAAKRIIRLQDGLIVSDELTDHGKAMPVVPPPVSAAKPVLHNVFKLSRVKDYFLQAMRALLSNKTRSLLSILGVLIGVTGLIAMLALGQGAQEATKKQMSSLGSNVLMVMPGHNARGGISYESGSVMRFTLDDVAMLKRSINGIDRIAPYVSGRGQVIYNASNYNTRVEGTLPDFVGIKNAQPASGRFFTQEEATSRAKVCVLGKTVVKNLFGDRDPLGEFIKINRTDFQVIGVLPEKGSSGWRDEDDKIEIPINTAMYRLLGREYVDNMDVQVGDPDKMDAVGDKIKEALLREHRLGADKEDTIDVRNMAEIQATITSTMKTFSYLLGSVAFISLLVGGIGIMNIMLVSVTERTREIGLRKAVGANNKDILFQFVIESISICVLGGLIGVLLGSLISITLAVFAGWQTMVAPSSIIISLTFSILIGLVFGTWPAKKASQLNPIEALRYE